MATFTLQAQAALLDLVDASLADAEAEGDRFVLVSDGFSVARPRTHEEAARIIEYLNARILRARFTHP